MIILVQTPHAWRGIRQRPHHLMSRFAKLGAFVRWVEPRYASWLADRPREFFRARRESPLDHLQVRPVTLLNGEFLPPIRWMNQLRLAWALRAKPPIAAEGPRVLWLYNPHEGHLAGRVPHDLLVYDIMDEYQGFPWSPRRIAGEESALLRRADWVFAGTQALYDAKRSQAEGRIECVLSGVDTVHFASNGLRTQTDYDHDAIRRRHARLAGYAGMIDLRIDQELLVETARRLTEWGFIMLGPVRGDVSRLAREPNIYLMGEKSYGELPAYYRAWDVALLPFVDSELTRHINPTKMLEYAAASVPIVARALPDVKQFYSRGAWLYETRDEFASALREIDAMDQETLLPRLEDAHHWADERGWDALAYRMLDRVVSLVKEKV